MTVLEIVDAKLHNEDSIPLRLAIEEVEQSVKNYCNIDKVPEELKFIVANMAIDLIRAEEVVKGQNPEGFEEVTLGDVASIKIGDTSVNLKGNSVAEQANNRRISKLDAIVHNYKAQLNRFRRMVW